jgi:hypothetical protein
VPILLILPISKPPLIYLTCARFLTASFPYFQLSHKSDPKIWWFCGAIM